MDDAIGAVIQKLQELGLEENTIIIYSGDHGPCEDKGTIYQGGTRIPCVMQWKAQMPGGRRVTALCQNIDWLPTFVEAADAEISEDMTVDGRSLMPVLKGETYEVPGREDLFFEHGYARGVRTARWKYMAYRLPEHIMEQMRAGKFTRAPDHSGSSSDVAKCLSVERHPAFFEPDQLYDLVNDPGEQCNLAYDPAYEDKLKEMRERLRSYLDTFANPYPLDEVSDFFFSETFQKLTEPYNDKTCLNELLWWTRKWHHRPEEVDILREKTGS